MANSTRANSSAKARSQKSTPATPAPKKPRFTLWLHRGTKQWCKKIGGKHYYFGLDKDAALEEYMRIKDDPEGHRSRTQGDEDRITVKELGDTFLADKELQIDAGDLTRVSFNDYLRTCQLMADHFGKNKAVESISPRDLLEYRAKLGESRGPNALGNEINRVRIVLKYADKMDLIKHPLKLGTFERPKKKAIRKHREKQGPRLFTPSQLRQLLEVSDIQMCAMILLGTNCGLGPADLGRLPVTAIDLKNGWLDFPRPKTGVERRCPLWRETIETLRTWLEIRREKSDEFPGLVFITKYNLPWYRDGSTSKPVSAEFAKLLAKLELRRPGLSFYSLRRTLQTIGDETADTLAVKCLMGHADNTISSNYREHLPDDRRLIKVSEHVRGWLYGTEGGAK